MAEAVPIIETGDDFIDLDRMRVVEATQQATNSHKLVGLHSRDQRSRPFNLLRTRFIKELADAKYRLVGITSATPAAGKSFLSTNLAASLSQIADTQVLLVDLDLRRGSIAHNLGIEFDVGINDYLTEKTQRLSDLGVRIEGTRLGVLPTKAMSADSAQALAGEPFRRLVETVRDRSGGALAIFDLPPVFANDDAMLSMQHLDGYILVVDSGRTTRRELQEAMGMLKPAPCIGTILNRYVGGVLDTYGYGSKAYDHYYSG